MSAKSVIGSKDVVGMFNEIIGQSPEDVNLDKAVPKYHKMEEHVKRFIQILRLLANAGFMRVFRQKDCEIIGRFAADMDDLRKRHFNAPTLIKDETKITHSAAGIAAAMFDSADKYKNVPDVERIAFGVAYRAVMVSPVVNIVITTCQNLTRHKTSLADKTKLKDLFLRGAGTVFRPIATLNFNFKELYRSDVMQIATNSKFALMILHKLYESSHDLYEAIASPDIDVEEFISLVTSAIDDLRKRVPRCHEAFDHIIKSVALLKDNFTTYYKDSLISGSPSTIMENFVLDVSKTADASPKLTLQFREIMKYYRKSQKESQDDPKMQAVFNQCNENFKALAVDEKNAKNDTETLDEAALSPRTDEAGLIDDLDGGLPTRTGTPPAAASPVSAATPTKGTTPMTITVVEPVSAATTPMSAATTPMSAATTPMSAASPVSATSPMSVVTPVSPSNSTPPPPTPLPTLKRLTFKVRAPSCKIPTPSKTSVLTKPKLGSQSQPKNNTPVANGSSKGKSPMVA